MIEILGIACYLMPIVIVLFRKPVAWMPIVVISLFLGWTGIGWVVAFCWACCGKTPAEIRHDEILTELLVTAKKKD